MSKSNCDRNLDALLDLDGVTMFIDERKTYWVKFEVTRITPTSAKPHGIHYSLTLHDPDSKRIIGYDNAHPVHATKGPGGKRTRSQDHRHRYDKALPYEFVDAGTLLEDFWANVNKILKEKRAVK